MTTRLMIRSILALGALGLATAAAAAVVDLHGADRLTQLRQHVLLALGGTLLLILAQGWCGLFTLGGWWTLRRHRSQEQTGEARGSRSPLLFSLAAVPVAIALAVVGFVLGFQALAGQVSAITHGVLAGVALLANASGLAAGWFVLEGLERRLDGIEAGIR